ncbi:stage V sporulation protein AD [Hathewaya histolytica]|uniref:stage V sporulation protein AD n=1 Tax=Hathewaya histolytica TaxID=1498 RepID=UPI003B679696
MSKKVGKQTLIMENKPRIVSTYNIVGPMEGQGPLKDYFDRILEDDLNGQDTFEKAESSLLYVSIEEAIKRANLKDDDIDFLFAGDLLNQLTASNFAIRDINIPFIGLYGACSTMALSLSMAAMVMDGGFAKFTVAATSSHFSSAERQFRNPLEYGSQMSPTAQRTVTGSGAMVLGKNGDYPYVTHVTLGKVKDYGETDPNNMGSAMAPAAVDTIKQHLDDTNRKPNDYDLIITGDLGKLGKDITEQLLRQYDYDISKVYKDCGIEVFDAEKQDVQCGGSGCGCSAVVTTGYIYKNMLTRKLKRVLLVSTGALMSPTSSLQGESIPSIAHAVAIEIGGKK